MGATADRGAPRRRRLTQPLDDDDDDEDELDELEELEELDEDGTVHGGAVTSFSPDGST